MKKRAIFVGISALILLACAADHAAPDPTIAAKTTSTLPPATSSTPSAAPVVAEPVAVIDAGTPASPAPVASSDAPAVDDDPNTGSFFAPPGVNPDDVREAVFRHMFGSNASGQQKGAGVYCIEVEGPSDPTAGFLARLKDVRPTVKGSSHCTASADQGVVDKTTHARGLEFRIETLKFKDAQHATATGGYYEAGLSASGNVYTLELKQKKWVVVKDQMMWIS